MKLGNVQNGVRVIDVCELMELLFGKDAYPKFTERSNKINQWVTENNAYYYTHEKQGFSILTAIRKTIESGKQIVVVENMS